MYIDLDRTSNGAVTIKEDGVLRCIFPSGKVPIIKFNKARTEIVMLSDVDNLSYPFTGNIFRINGNVAASNTSIAEVLAEEVFFLVSSASEATEDLVLQTIAGLDSRSIAQSKVTGFYSNRGQMLATRPSGGTVAIVAGYLTPADGGHGMYVYDANSNFADDGGIILAPTVGSGNGRWRQLPNNGWIDALTFGVKADGLTDDTTALQASLTGTIAAGYNAQWPRGKIKTTEEITIGVASSDPNFNLTTFKIRGAGVGADSNAPVFPGAAGTAIRLYGEGHRSVVCFEESNWRYGGISNLTVECDTDGGAEFGILFADTRFSQFNLRRIHSDRVLNCYGILKGNGNNGEFLDIYDCAGFGGLRWFYMEGGTGQSYNHAIYNCRGGVKAGGKIFDIGGSDPGYGFSCYSFNSTSIGDGAAVAAIYDSAPPTTFLNLRGANGIFEFSGGRNEHISCITNSVNGSNEFTAQVNFKTVFFGGMISTSERKTFTSSGPNNNTNILMTDGCKMEGIGGQVTEFGFDLAAQESMKYEFNNARFVFTSYNTSIGKDDRIAFINCQRDFYGENSVRFSTVADKKETKLNSLGAYSNFLKDPAFTAGFPTLPDSWTLETGTIFALRGPEEIDIDEKEPYVREFVLSTGATIYQDVEEFDFSSETPATAFYKARVGGRLDSNDQVLISLENSETGRVYDSFRFVPSPGFYNVLLMAHDYSGSGLLRVKITALSGVPTFSIQTQLVSDDINANYYKQEFVTLPVDSRIVYFGDSLTDDGISDSGATNQFTSYGFTTLAEILAGSPYLMPYGGNEGIGGQTTTQMVSRLGAAISFKAKIATVLAGTNDIGAFATASTIIANLERIYNAFLSSGAILIVIPIFPRADFSPEQEEVRTAVNAWIRGKEGVKNIFVADPTHLLTSPGTVYRDGIHLNSYGAYLVGRVVATYLRLFAPEQSVADLIFADQVIGANTFLTGTSGTLNGATGSAADDWTLYGGAGAGGAAVVGSKDGNAQVITISGNYTGNDKNVAFGQYAFSTPFATNDLIEGILDLEIVSHNSAISNVYLDVSMSGAGGSIASNRSIVRTDNLSMSLPNGRYIMRTPASPLTEAATFIAMLFYIEFVNTAGNDPVQCVVKINRIAVRKVLI